MAARRNRRKPVTEPTSTAPIDPAIASDIDGDGILDLDPAKAQETMIDLVVLDHQLRAEGSSLASILRILAHTSQGIRV